MVFAADEGGVMIFPAWGVVGGALGADVVIGIGVVPEEYLFKSASRDSGGDHVGAIGGLFCVDAHPIVDGGGGVGGDDDRAGGYGGGAVVDLRGGGLAGFFV